MQARPRAKSIKNTFLLSSFAGIHFHECKCSILSFTVFDFRNWLDKEIKGEQTCANGLLIFRKKAKHFRKIHSYETLRPTAI